MADGPATETAGGPLAARFPALTSFDFRRLFVNSFLTTGSRWAQVLARGWLVHDLSGGSTGAVGLVTFASFAPFVVVGPFAGATADRFDRRRLLIAATVFGIAGASLLALITFAGVAQVWHIVVLAFATGSAQAITVPTRHALLANVVPPEHLLNAVAMAGISQHGSRIVGPLFGAAFLGALGARAVFAFSAVLLTLALVEAIRIRYRPSPDGGDAASPEQGPAPVSVGAAVARMFADLGDAARYVRADPRLLVVIALVAAHCSLTMAFDSMMPTLAERVGGAETLYSSILIGLGFGAFSGTLGVSQLRRERSRGVAFAAAGTGSGLAMLVLGLATTPSVVVFGAVLAGLTQASYMTMSAALVQNIVSDAYRGRVMSFYLMIAAGHMAILNLGYGRTAEVIDVRILLVGPGLIWTVLFIGSVGVIGEVRALVSRGRFRSMSTAAVPA